MGKIYCMMGKSSTGKDTLYKRILAQPKLALKTFIPYTTRTVRAGEQNGVEYIFCGEDAVEKLEKEGKIIELRAYHTIQGIWKYFTVDDGNIDLQNRNYLVIGTLESFVKTADYFSRDKVLPIYIEVDDGIRLERAIQRERRQETPKYEEMCRRFLADAADFSEEKLEEAGITRVFENDDLERCVQEIEEYLLSILQ